VFPSRRGTPMEPDNLRRSWYAIRKDAGLGQTRFHDLRHTRVTLLLDLGAPGGCICCPSPRISDHGSGQSTSACANCRSDCRSDFLV
jgi:integrase